MITVQFSQDEFDTVRVALLRAADHLERANPHRSAKYKALYERLIDVNFRIRAAQTQGTQS